jgi:hypothetical protein
MFTAHLLNPFHALLAPAVPALDTHDCLVPCYVSLGADIDLSLLARHKVGKHP